MYSAPGTIDNTTDINTITTASGAQINSQGYFRRDNVLTIDANSGGGGGTNSGTLSYTTFTDTPFIFSSYSDRIIDGQYSRGSNRAGVDANGLPNTQQIIGTEIDAFNQNITEANVPLSTVPQNTTNGSYRQIKQVAHTSTALIDWSDVVSAYTATGFTTPLQVSLFDSGSTSITGGATPTELRLRTNTANPYTPGTGDGLINTITSTNSNIAFDLGGAPINGVNLAASVGEIRNARVFSTLQVDPSTNYSFNNCTLEGTISVDAPSDVYIVFNGVTPSGALIINRGTGTGTVFVQGLPEATNDVTFGANVEDSPITIEAINLPTSANIITDIFNNTGTLNTTPIATITGNGNVSTGLSGFSGVTDIRVVSAGPGFTSRVTDITLGGSNIQLDLGTLIPVSYPSTALSDSSIMITSGTTGQRVYVDTANTTFDSANGSMLVAINGNQIGLTDGQLNDWMQRAVKILPEYRQVVASNNGEFIGSSGALGFANASSERIRFTPGSNNASYNFGFLANDLVGSGPAAYSVSRTLTLQDGSTTPVTVAFALSTAEFDAAVIDVAITNANLATNTDVTNAINSGVSLNATGQAQVANQVRRNA